MKNNLFTVCCFFAAMFFGSSALALDHGSISIKDALMYSTVNDTANTESTAIEDVSIDYKLVTIGSNTWIWANLKGTTLIWTDGNWASQLKWDSWTGDDYGFILNGGGNVSGKSVTYGKKTSPFPNNPIDISIFQYTNKAGWDSWNFYMTDKSSYDNTLPNNKDLEDVTAPILADPVIFNQIGTEVTLVLSATDASNDYFYYVTDEGNSYEEVFFSDTAKITMNADVNYTFSVKAIDFSGNESEVKTINVYQEAYECNNLLSGNGLEMAYIYFAPDWTENSNYTTEIDNDTLKIHLDDETSEIWMAQFHLNINPEIYVYAGKQYTLLADVEVSSSTPVTLQAKDTVDNVLIELGPATANAGVVNHLAAYDITTPATLDVMQRLIFAFGGNPANVDIKIYNIAVCGQERTPSVAVGDLKKADNSAMAVYMQGKTLTVTSKNAIKQIDVFSTGGHKIPVKQNGNTVDMSSLASGLYIIRVTDAAGVQKQFKQIISGR
jgi:hypothetical protein